MRLFSCSSRRCTPLRGLSFSGLVLVLFLPLAAWAAAPLPYAQVVPGHSAMWYDPARDGEGWMLEILADDRAVLYWFTFDEAGNPRWLAGFGEIDRRDGGDEIRFDDLFSASGARFGSGFDPADVAYAHQGHATLRFLDCDRGEVAFDAYGRQGEFSLARLTRPMGADGCRPIHGTPGEPVQAYAGQSGSWFDPAWDGQGYSLEWLSDGSAALVWFTFDGQGQPYWMIATGEPDDGKIVFENVSSVQGGRFVDAFDPEQVRYTPWGGLELALECDSGEARWTTSAEGFSAGSLQLQRLTRLASPACPWVKPKLTDLYDFEWTELPIPAYTTPLNPVNFKMNSIADDGTVVGQGRWDGWAGIVRLRPGETEWEKVMENGSRAFITPDGKTVYATQPVSSPPEETSRPEYHQLMIWNETEGLRPALGMIFPSNVPYGISKNGKWLVGEGFALNGEGAVHAWKWSEETGQVALEQWGAPFGISDDGSVAVGIEVTPPNRANIWINGVRHPMFDDEGVRLGFAWTCNSDCSMVVGHHQHPMTSWPESYRPWYRIRSGSVTYLDIPDGAYESIATSTSTDGSLIAGGQVIWDQSLVVLTEEGWLWSEDTSTVSLRDILEGEGDLQFTDRWNRKVKDVSSDGTKILFSGIKSAPKGGLQQYRAGILRLIPKVSKDALHQPAGVIQHETSE